MGSDEARIGETKPWLEKAAGDLRAAEHEFKANPPLLDDIVFHCQQAIEKLLKGFLTWHDEPFRKTHDLGETGQQCVRIDASLEPLLRRAAPLTEYAWKFRYPGEMVGPTPAEAEEAFQLARLVFKTILSRLPAEVHP